MLAFLVQDYAAGRVVVLVKQKDEEKLQLQVK